MKIKRSAVFTLCLSVVVILAVVAGLISIDSPGKARNKRLDKLTLQDLNSISRAVEAYQRTHEALPASLDQLIESREWSGHRLNIPASEARYEYRPQEGNAYELCAQFRTTLDASTDNGSDKFWHHGPGRSCFQLKALAKK